MADDLDSLLREIEGALSGAEDISSASSTKTSENKTHQVTTFSFRSIDSRSNSTHSYENSFKKNQQSSRSDLDDLLALTDDIESQEKEKQSMFAKTQSTRLQSQSRTVSVKRCLPVCIGASGNERGYTSGPARRRGCNSLRCTGCDFAVICFDNFAWSTDADYIFFRNSMPDELRLRSKLRPQSGSSAYCCQCSWRNVRDLETISQIHDLNWVCGGHEYEGF